jgi:thiol-disulfide isomerase/thioredoxin
VVIEFWAAWCAPCVAQIPRWTRLVEKFKDRPIQFIAVTNDEEDLGAFLKRWPVSGWIALDPEGETLKAYGVEAIPRTVLVDSKGIVRGVTSLANLADSDIEGLLGGRELKIAAQPGGG